LALAVEKREHEVKEVALAKVTWRLFLKVRPIQAHAVHSHTLLINETSNGAFNRSVLKHQDSSAEHLHNFVIFP